MQLVARTGALQHIRSWQKAATRWGDNSLSQLLVHLEHVDSFALEDRAEGLVADDFALVLWILHVVRLDVLPQLFHNLRP